MDKVCKKKACNWKLEISIVEFLVIQDHTESTWFIWVQQYIANKLLSSSSHWTIKPLDKKFDW